MNSLLPPTCLPLACLARWKACVRVFVCVKSPRYSSGSPALLYSLHRQERKVSSFRSRLRGNFGGNDSTALLGRWRQPSYLPFRFTYPFIEETFLPCKWRQESRDTKENWRLIKKPWSLCSHFEKGSVEYARNEFFHSIRVIKVVKSIRLRQERGETWRTSRLKLKFPFGPTWYSRSFFMNSLPLWDF